MQIQVEIISVSSPQTIPTKNGKSYQAIEVAYKKDGKIEGKKIMSFAAPAVFKAVQSLNAGDTVSVTIEKNEAGYWQWVGIDEGGGSTAPAQSAAAPARAAASGTPQKAGNWETAEERAARQVMIVRQSSLSSAVALANATGDKKASTASIIDTAKEFEAYVLGTDKPSAAKAPEVSDDSFPDDIPY